MFLCTENLQSALCSVPETPVFQHDILTEKPYNDMATIFSYCTNVMYVWTELPHCAVHTFA